MLTRKGNLICKSLVFVFAVITAMTLDSCCDDCLGGSKGSENLKHSSSSELDYDYYSQIGDLDSDIKDPKPGWTETSDKETKTSNEDKETAGFKKTKDKKFFWIFGTPLFYSAKEGMLYYVNKNGDLVEEGGKKDNCNIFEDILIKYLKGFNSNYKNIEINNIKVENDDLDFDISFKVIFIGNAGVGKSQICNRGIKKSFENVYMPTLGFEFFTRTTNINNGKIFKLQIWDVCGQEAYRSLVGNFFMNASIIILVYDVTNKESFEGLNSWYYNEIKNTAPEGAAIFVVGNKCDLIEKDKISAQVKAVDKWIKDKCEQK